MKLLIVSHPSVVPVNQELFARVEADSGWRLSIVVPSRWKSEYGQRRPVRSRHFAGRLIPTPVALSGNIPLHAYLGRLRRTIARERPDAIYVQHEAYGVATFQTFAANRRSRNVPIGFFSCQNLVKRYPWPFSALERFVYQHANFAFPVSAAVATVLRTKGYRGPAAVLPFSIDTSTYSPGGDTTRAHRNGPLTVGYVGRLATSKGIDTLLAAIELVGGGKVRAVIAGDGPAAEPLRRQASQLGLDDRVRWTGYVPHDRTPEHYRALDLVVVPSRTTASWKEQFGRVVIEALACGVPVVTSDSGELPHLVETSGGGWTFPEGDAPALAQLLTELTERRDDLAERGTRGRLSVQRDFDVRVVASRFVEGITSACGRESRG